MLIENIISLIPQRLLLFSRGKVSNGGKTAVRFCCTALWFKLRHTVGSSQLSVLFLFFFKHNQQIFIEHLPYVSITFSYCSPHCEIRLAFLETSFLLLKSLHYIHDVFLSLGYGEVEISAVTL